MRFMRATPLVIGIARMLGKAGAARDARLQPIAARTGAGNDFLQLPLPAPPSDR
jgi:hypothetical protein